MKKILMTLASAMILALAGCGGSTPGPQPQPKGEEITAQEAKIICEEIIAHHSESSYVMPNAAKIAMSMSGSGTMKSSGMDVNITITGSGSAEYDYAKKAYSANQTMNVVSSAAGTTATVAEIGEVYNFEKSDGLYKCVHSKETVNSEVMNETKQYQVLADTHFSSEAIELSIPTLDSVLTLIQNAIDGDPSLTNVKCYTVKAEEGSLTFQADKTIATDEYQVTAGFSVQYSGYELSYVSTGVSLSGILVNNILSFTYLDSANPIIPTLDESWTKIN